MFCSNCGHEVAEGAMFCATCGSKVNNSQAAENKAVDIEPVSFEEAEPIVTNIVAPVKKGMSTAAAALLGVGIGLVIVAVIAAVIYFVVL